MKKPIIFLLILSFVFVVGIYFVIPVFAQTTALPNISSVSAIEITANSAIITWATNNVPSDSQVEYGLTTTYGLQTVVNANFVLGHIVTLSNLNPSIVYHYRVKSKDATGKIAISQDYTFTTISSTSLSKLIISSPQVINVARNSANIVWTTNNLSDSHIYYSYSSSSVTSSWNHFVDSALVSYHNIVLPGLKSGTTTYFFIESIDKNLNSAKSDASSFVTIIDTTSPQISNILAKNITKNFATITWTTSEPMNSYVEYGTTPSYYLASAISTSSSIFVTDHSVNLYELKDGYSYHYRIKSRGENGNLAVSDDQTFQTISSCTGLNFSLNNTTFLPSDYVVYTFSCLPSGSAPMINIQMLKPNGVIATLATVYNKSEGSMNFTASTNLMINPLGTYKLFACFTSNCQVAPIATAAFTIIGNNNISAPQTTSNIPSIVASTADLQATIKQLQYQIKTLQAQIEELKTQVAEVNAELNLTRTLRRGLSGDDVKQLQYFLKQQYPDFYFGPITGYFGSLTESAVKKLQEKEGIEAIGVVGPKTTAKLNELLTEGAGASGVIPQGLLTAPGIEKKIETTTPVVVPTVPVSTPTSTVLTTTPVTLPSVQPATIAPTGVCLIKDRYTDIPRFDIANVGNGFAKYAVSGINTILGLQTSCTKTIYDYLLQNYCKSNGTPVQRLIMTYGANNIGIANSLSCSSQGCNFIDCSSVSSLAQITIPTTTPSGTIPATPATPATPAQPISVTGTSTVPAISATPATPAQPASTTTTTTTTADTTPPSVTITGPEPGFANSNCTVILRHSMSDNSGTIIFQEKINGVNYGSEISNSTIPNGYITGSGCKNLANGTHTYTIVARDPSGNITTKDLNFSLPLTTADTTPPVISGVRSPQATLYNTSAGIEWETNEAADSDLEYGLTANYGSPSGLFSTLITSHSIGFSGLTPETTYHYRVKSKDAAGNLATSGDYTFQTLSNAATYPTLSVSSNPSGATVTNINSGYIYCQSTPCSVQVVTQFSISANIKVSKTGYYDWTNLIRLNPKTTTTVNATLLATATSTSSLNTRVKNLAAISQILNSLNEILGKLSQILK